MFVDRKIQDLTSFNLLNRYFLNPSGRNREQAQYLRALATVADNLG